MAMTFDRGGSRAAGAALRRSTRRTSGCASCSRQWEGRRYWGGPGHPVLGHRRFPHFETAGAGGRRPAGEPKAKALRLLASLPIGVGLPEPKLM